MNIFYVLCATHVLFVITDILFERVGTELLYRCLPKNTFNDLAPMFSYIQILPRILLMKMLQIRHCFTRIIN